MRLSLAWLAEWIDLPPVEELEHRLTLGGLEIEAEESLGPDFAGIVVGHVLEREPHPQADRLSLCRVDLGTGQPLEIVCGAPNVAAGQKVAVAPPGARLPDGTKLKRAKIRGVVSNGMICSARELGLGEDHTGILELDARAEVGTPFSDVVSVGDRVLEVALTPNRGDCASLLGIAREVRAHCGGDLRVPPHAVESEAGESAADAFRVEIEDPAACHRYVARLVRGVRVGPSPEWLSQRLEAAGVRSINCVVDVTNLVLLEFGQPIHAFDAHRLKGNRIVVRRARAGEQLATLDDQTRVLDAEDLVIADAERAVAVAGVMGGAETEVGETTRDVLIESAHFDPTCVRRTARRLGLSTEASYRFERGVDSAGIERAADRAARLLAELAGGKVAPGRAAADGNPVAEVEPVALRPARVNRLLGTDLEVGEIAALLERLSIAAELDPEGVLRCPIPSYRGDLRIEADLVEEVARIYGYDRIRPTLPTARLAGTTAPPLREAADRVRDTLCQLGWIECMTLPMEGPDAHDRLGLGPDDPRREAVALRNPLVDDERLLRTQLLASALRVARLNLTRQREEVRVFEIGRAFRPRAGEALPDERTELVALLAGGARHLWRPQVPVFFECKGVAERLLAELGARAALRTEVREPFLHPGASARFDLAERPVAVFGELHPETARRFEIAAPCALLWLDLQALAAPASAARFEAVSRQPSVFRDLAFLVGRDQAAGAMLDAIRETGGRRLVRARLFDRYEGRGVPEDKVSLAFRLFFQDAERTLTEAEVGKAIDRIVRVVSERFGAELR